MSKKIEEQYKQACKDYEDARDKMWRLRDQLVNKSNKTSSISTARKIINKILNANSK